jgi:hypothetical protein
MNTESYARIVPTALQNELIRLRDAITLTNWRIGDICTEILTYCRANHIVASKEDVYSAVGAFVGKRARTIREFHHISMSYPLELREAYSELSYDHFRTALTFGNRAHESLDWCMDEVERLNRPATVDAMEAHFGAPIGEDPQLNYPGSPPPPPANTSPLWQDESVTQESPAPQQEQPISPNAFIMPHVENAWYLLKRLRDEVANFPEEIEEALPLLDTLESQLMILRLKYKIAR